MVKVIELGSKNSIINNYIAELRDVNIQNDRMKFRRNLERIGEAMAFEISKSLEYKEVTIKTPLGEKNMNVIAEQPVIGTIMRAGLPLHQGFLNVFDNADNVFIAAYRKYDKNEDFEISVEYYSAANINRRTFILVDTMLATGASIVNCLKGLVNEENIPAKLHIASVIASKYGIEHIKKCLSNYNITLWVGNIDDELTSQAFIVPGLGDAGDLAFGPKTD
ncbi:MAG: uracil phosphoribosyltransferase [Candidatus Limimorpha sp.]